MSYPGFNFVDGPGGGTPLSANILNGQITVPLKNQSNRIDAIEVITGAMPSHTVGVYAAMPPATAVRPGSIYLTTNLDFGTSWMSDGTNWKQLGAPVGKQLLRGTLTQLASVAANSVSQGTFYVVTDANGGTLFQSDGSNWQQAAAAVSAGQNLSGAGSVFSSTTADSRPLNSFFLITDLAGGTLMIDVPDPANPGHNKWIQAASAIQQYGGTQRFYAQLATSNQGSSFSNTWWDLGANGGLQTTIAGTARPMIITYQGMLRADGAAFPSPGPQLSLWQDGTMIMTDAPQATLAQNSLYVARGSITIPPSGATTHTYKLQLIGHPAGTPYYATILTSDGGGGLIPPAFLSVVEG